jgi:hypothetical protein
VKLITDPYPYSFTKYGLSVDPPNKEILRGQEAIIIRQVLGGRVVELVEQFQLIAA